MVGDKPEGLVDCYLLEADRMVQIAAVWVSEEHHERAMVGDEVHPGLRIFSACGIDPTHVTYRVVARLH